MDFHNSIYSRPIFRVWLCCFVCVLLTLHGYSGNFLLAFVFACFFTVLLQAFIQQFIVDILVLLNFCSNMNIIAAICIYKTVKKLRAFQKKTWNVCLYFVIPEKYIRIFKMYMKLRCLCYSFRQKTRSF